MKVTLEEYGGLAAGIRRQPQVVDANAVPKPAAEELSQLVAAATAAPGPEDRPGPVRDAMSYTITVEGGDGPILLEQTDGSMSPAFAALLNWIRRHAGKK